jgi:hypothetical protein
MEALLFEQIAQAVKRGLMISFTTAVGGFVLIPLGMNDVTKHIPLSSLSVGNLQELVGYAPTAALNSGGTSVLRFGASFCASAGCASS